jgi:hydroxymethylpyrimidine pyrophosphatase-like HAD family hydrolase
MEPASSAPPPVLVFGDLDDTLFQTRAKCPPGCELVPVAYDRAGQPLSFATEKQRRLFAWLTRDAEFVPVTGRNSAAVARVRLPFDRWAITSFGGVILTPGGRPDPAWAARMADESRAHHAALGELRAHVLALAAREGVDVRASEVCDHSLPLYLSVKHNAGDHAALAGLAERIAGGGYPAGWRMHLNGNNLACLPPYLAKERAVAYFLETLAAPGTLTFGFGDSHSDAPYIALCDYALTPTGSQLGRHLHAVRAYAHG